MKFTDLFIKAARPFNSNQYADPSFWTECYHKMQIRQYPRMDNTVITIMTSYPGADADLIAGFITSPIESAVASAEGIDYMTSPVFRVLVP